MIIAKLTSKGQVTLPKAVREKLGVHSGEEVGFEVIDGRLVITKVLTRSPFEKWRGRLEHLRDRRSDDLVKEARGHDDGD